MQKKLALTQTVAVALLFLLVVAIGFLIKDHTTIATLKAQAEQNLTAKRDVIREDCAATDAEAGKRCADDLQALSDLLAKFRVTAPLPTTTPAKADLNKLKLDTSPKQ